MTKLNNCIKLVYINKTKLKQKQKRKGKKMEKATITKYRNKENTVDFAVISVNNERHLVCLSSEKYLGQVDYDISIDGLISCSNEIELNCDNETKFLDLAIEAERIWN